MEFEIDSKNPVPSYDKTDFAKYFKEEKEAMAAPGYAESKEAILREVAVNEIVKNSKSEKFDAFIPYLALNYFDRFISRNQLPNVVGRVRDDIVLAANCCLTIAWKMRDHSFSFLKFQREKNLDAEYQNHILEMELHILNGLDWRMRAVLALCFVSFFLAKSSVKGIKRRVVNDIIIQAQGDIGFTLYRPSVIAAATVLAACRLLVRDDNVEMPPHRRCRQNLIKSGCVQTKELDRCCDKVIDMCTQKHMYMERVEEFMEDLMLKVEGARPLDAGRPSQFAPRSYDEEASSSSSSRPPKEPEHEIEEVEEPEIDNKPGLDFDLKWLLVTNEQREVTIDSPLFRSPAEAIDKTSIHEKCGACTLL